MRRGAGARWGVAGGSATGPSRAPVPAERARRPSRDRARHAPWPGVYPQVASGPGEPALDVIVVESDRSVQGYRGVVADRRVDDRALHAGVVQTPESLPQHRRRVVLPVKVRMRRDGLEVAHAADRVRPRDAHAAAWPSSVHATRSQPCGYAGDAM